MIHRSEHSYQLFGALRRLKDWHNAVITFVKTESCVESEEMQGIQRLLTASSLEEEDSRLREAADVIWRGKLSVIDKTVRRFKCTMVNQTVTMAEWKISWMTIERDISKFKKLTIKLLLDTCINLCFAKIVIYMFILIHVLYI